jgi:cobalt-zinc-cadmium efflux system protein
MGHEHHHNEYEGHGGGAVRFAFAIALNVIITIAEYAGGVLSGSLALISDAGHNLSDVLSLILGYAGERVSRMSGGRMYTFGLKRFEVLIALLNALFLLGVGGWIVYEAVERFLNPVPVKSGVMLAVAIVGLAGNLISMLVLGHGRESSINVRSAFLHLLYDAVSSVAVIATAIVLMFTDFVLIDLAVSALIVAMIAWSSSGIIGEAMRIFLQGSPRGIDPEEVIRRINALPEVAGVHGLHIWSVSSTEVFLSCHICLSGEGSGSDGLIQRVNRMLEDEFGITHTAIQVEQTLLCTLGDGSSCCR